MTNTIYIGGTVLWLAALMRVADFDPFGTAMQYAQMFPVF